MNTAAVSSATASLRVRSSIRLSWSIALACVGAVAVNLHAQDQAITGNMTVTGNVGVGTTTPQAKVDVVGSINIDSSSGYQQGGLDILYGTGQGFFVGPGAGNRTNTGSSNTGVGFSALSSLTSGYSNAGFGTNALQNTTTGIANMAFGYRSMANNTSGSYNAAIGMRSLQNNTSGSANVAIGLGAGVSNTTGGENIYIGNGTAQNVSTGSYNLLIGYSINAQNPTGSNQLSIGNLIFGTGIDGQGTTISSGNIGIGVASPAAKLDVAGVVRNQGLQITNLASAALLGTDASGNVTAVSASTIALTGTQVTTGLGYTPANKAGDTLTGNLKLVGGSTTVSPLTFQSGSLLTTPVFGALEFDGTNAYLTNNAASPTRKTLAYTATTLAGYGITDPVVLTSGNYADPAWLTSLAAAKLSGTIAAGAMPAYSGDVSSSAGSLSLSLATTGVGAGTYTKVTVDTKGRVTTGASLASSDVTTALGYTPYNSTNPAGYITSVSVPVQSVFGRTGNVTLNSSDVTTAFGYTPVNKAGDTLTGNLKFAAGTTSLAPLSLQTGSVLTTPTFGAVEFDGTNVYVTNNSASPTRKTVAFSATTLAGYGITDPVVLSNGTYADPSWVTSLSAAKLTTGTLPASAMPAHTGDVTSSAGSTALSLATTGVSAGTYVKVTVDTKGRVTAGAALASTDVTTALGYTPYNGTTNPAGYITAAGVPVQSVFGRTGAVALTSADVTGALGYTPVGSVGGALTGNLKLMAGTSAIAPLTLQTGSVLTTPTFGAVEFDGTNVYVTNNSASPTRKTVAFSATTLAGYGITDPVVLTSGTYADPSWLTSLSAAKLSGSVAAAAMPAFSGDVSSSAGSLSLSLATTGVAAGTYAKVTVDTKGRVTAGAALASADVATALGYTPYNSTNPSGYITAAGAPVQSVFGRTGTITMASGDVTTALGYTPYNATNPSGYITASGVPVQSVFGRTGNVTLTAADLTSALTFTPVNKTGDTLTGTLTFTAGTTTVAPLKLQNGSLLTTPTFGAVEFDGTTLYVTTNTSSPTRKAVAYTATTLAGYGITDPVALTSGSYADPSWLTSLSAAKLSGNIAAAAMPAFSGDVTSSAGSLSLSLATTGVAAGTYAKVTVDTKGRVTAGAALASTDVTTALGYTPYNGTTNPAGYITAASALVQSVNGRTGNVTISSSDVTTALGYTPLSSSNGTFGGTVSATGLSIQSTAAPAAALQATDAGTSNALNLVRLYHASSAQPTIPGNAMLGFGSQIEFSAPFNSGSGVGDQAVIGSAYFGSTGNSSALYFQTANAGTLATRVIVDPAGNVGIGTLNPDKPLTVKGTIHAGEVIVDAAVTANDLKIQPKVWADDVFDADHHLEPLSQVEQQIKANKHLPGIPSAQDVAANGISVGDMQARLLAKIEELTLHQIEQEKRIEKLEAENAALRRR